MNYHFIISCSIQIFHYNIPPKYFKHFLHQKPSKYEEWIIAPLTCNLQKVCMVGFAYSIQTVTIKQKILALFVSTLEKSFLNLCLFLWSERILPGYVLCLTLLRKMRYFLYVIHPTPFSPNVEILLQWMSAC